MQVQNEIIGAINELRNEFSQEVFQKQFPELTEEQQNAVKLKFPYNISETEPNE